MAELQPVPDLKKYVDVEDALARVCGNKMIYKTLLGTFKKSLQYGQLRDEVAEGRYEDAAKTAHSIKGVTANLSLKAAYEKVLEVELQLKGGAVNQADVDELGEIIETTLECTEYVAGTL